MVNRVNEKNWEILPTATYIYIYIYIHVYCICTIIYKVTLPFSFFFLHYYVYTALLSESSSLIKATSVVFPLKTQIIGYQLQQDVGSFVDGLCKLMSTCPLLPPPICLFCLERISSFFKSYNFSPIS